MILSFRSCRLFRPFKYINYSRALSSLAEPHEAKAKLSRTVHVGSLPAAFSLEELLASTYHSGQNFGPLERINVRPNENCLFLEFLHEEGASKFFQSARQRELAVAGQKLTFGWGKQAPASSRLICAVGLRNSSRTLRFTNMDLSWTANALREKLQKYGFVEHVHMNREQECAFVSFMDIITADQVCIL